MSSGTKRVTIVDRLLRVWVWYIFDGPRTRFTEEREQLIVTGAIVRVFGGNVQVQWCPKQYLCVLIIYRSKTESVSVFKFKICRRVGRRVRRHPPPDRKGPPGKIQRWTYEKKNAKESFPLICQRTQLFTVLLTRGCWSLITVFMLLIYLSRPIISRNTIMRKVRLTVFFLGSIFPKTLKKHSQVKYHLKTSIRTYIAIIWHIYF